MLASWGWVVRALDKKADKPDGSVAAEEARARRERDAEIFKMLGEIKERQNQTAVSIARIEGDVKSIKVKIGMNGVERHA